MANFNTAKRRFDISGGAKLRRRRDEDPCSTMKCEHFCVTRGGQAGRCVCHRGYKLQPNGYSCRGKSQTLRCLKNCNFGTVKLTGHVVATCSVAQPIHNLIVHFFLPLFSMLHFN